MMILKAFPQLEWSHTFSGDPSEANLPNWATKLSFHAHVRLRSEGKDCIRKTINVLEKIKFSFLTLLIHQTVTDQIMFCICARNRSNVVLIFGTREK